MVPEALHWLFWNVDVRSLDTERDAAAILGRVLERGRMDDVRWAVRMYGLERIERFFREGGHPEISRRTRLFWRAALGVRRDAWPEPEASRASSAAPWID
jgi:hypothetical protein